MATNPIQRKARNSFLLGMLLMLIIMGAVATLLVFQLKNYKDKEKAELANSANVWVLSQDVISGQVITTDMLQQQVINKKTIPNNAIGNMAILDNYSLEDKEGNSVITEYKNNNAILYLSKDGSKYELKQEDTGNYYIEVNKEKKYVELANVPIIAKVNMNKNTIVTTEMISKSNEKTADDVRKQEYNMLVLPTQIQNEEYVDVRLALPTGEDYIVIAKKQVEIPQISGIDAQDTIWLKLSEAEILTMNNAIVDAYRILGSKIYVTTYTEAGIQTAAIPTYVPSNEVAKLIQDNPNIITTAKNELISRYNNNTSTRNNVLNNAINNSGTDGEDSVKTKVEESITATKENRKTYLESLGGDY